MKKTNYFGLLFLLLLTIGCSRNNPFISFWPLDVDKGYRLFLGIPEKDSQYPVLILHITDDEGNPYCEPTGLEMTEYGVYIGDYLYYYYDIPEEFQMKSIEVTFSFSSPDYSSMPLTIELKDDHNLWFILREGSFNQIVAPVNKDSYSVAD